MVTPNPTVQLSYGGHEITVFTQSTPDQLTKGLDRALELYLALAAEKEKAKKIGINVRAGFYGVVDIQEPQLRRMREFVDALVKTKPDLSVVEKVYVTVNDDTFEAEMQSKQYPFCYRLWRPTDLKDLDELMKNIASMEGLAANIVSRKVTFAENSFPELPAMKRLEEAVKSNDYAGYRAEFVRGAIKAEGKDAKVLQDGRVIAEPSKGILRVSTEK